MSPSSFAILITVGLALASVAGDYFLKLASDRPSPILTWQFVAGFFVYALTAFGWVIVMPHLKLASIGVVFSLTVVLSLCLVGAIFFKESLSTTEWLGVVLAVTSLLLLHRVA